MESEADVCIGKAYKIGEEKNLIDVRLGKFSVAAMWCLHFLLEPGYVQKKWLGKRI